METNTCEILVIVDCHLLVSMNAVFFFYDFLISFYCIITWKLLFSGEDYIIEIFKVN